MSSASETGNPEIPAWVILALFIPFVGILVLNANYYLPFISDDTLISLRYAQRLLEGHGLTWTDGHPVEGYSNLLWVLLIALLGAFGVDLIAAARILGILGMASIMFAMSYWYLSRNTFRKTWFPLTMALLFLSIGAPIAVWAIGGLEQPLYGALIAASISLMYSVIESGEAEKRRILLLSFVLGLVCITRPDGPIFTVAGTVALMLDSWCCGRRRPTSSLFLVLLFPIVFYAGQLIFRLYYYGEVVPNTALVKINPSMHHFSNGLEYLSHGLGALSPFSFLAIASVFAMLLSSPIRGRGIYLLAILVMWSTYIVFIGGDIFPAYRHFIPLMVVFAFALVDGFSMAINRFRELPRPKYYFLLLAASIILIVPYTYLQFAHEENQRAVYERWEWQGREIGLMLKSAFSAQQPLMAVTAAGCLPYWSKLPALDMLGLNDYYLPRHPPANIGSGYIGHELGDARYVLDRKPDIIIFNEGLRPEAGTELEMERMPEFRRAYTPVVIKTSSETEEAVIYFNKYSHKIGVQKSQSTIAVPGFLFEGEGAVAYLNKANKFVTRITKGNPVRVTLDDEPSQDWFVDIKTSAQDKVGSEFRQEGSALSITLFSENTEPIEIEEVVLRSKARL